MAMTTELKFIVSRSTATEVGEWVSGQLDPEDIHEWNFGGPVVLAQAGASAAAARLSDYVQAQSSSW